MKQDLFLRKAWEMFLRLKRIVSQWMECLLRVRLAEVCCLSRLADKTIRLATEYVDRARGIRIELTLHWPLLEPRLIPPKTAVRLTGLTGQADVQPSDCFATRSVRSTRIRLDVPASAIAGRRDFQLEIVRAKHGQRLGSIAFHALDLAAVGSELRVERLNLFALKHGERVWCDHLHNQVEQVGFSAELSLDNAEHRSFLNQMEVELHATLETDLDPHRQVESWRGALRFDGHSYEWKQRLGTAPTLFGETLGQYRLCLRFGDAVLAAKAFPVTSLSASVETARNAVKQQSSLKDLVLTAINHRCMTVPLDVVAEDFCQITVGFSLNTPQPDPLLDEVELTLSLALRHRNQTIHTQSRSVTLKPGQQRFQENLNLTPEWFEPGAGKYQLELLLDDRSLTGAAFRHKTRAQIKAEKGEAILQSLVLDQPRLFAGRDGARVETDHLFETDGAVTPTFCIKAVGLDDDVPGIKWRLGLKWLNLDSGKTVEEHRFLCVKSEQNTQDDLELSLPSPGRYVLQLCKRDEVLTEFRFRVLSKEEIIPHAKQVVIGSLRAEAAQLFIQAGPTRYQCRYVPDTSDFLLPEVTIHSHGYNSFLPQFQTQLQLFLVRSGEGRAELATRPVTLSAAPLVLRNLAIKVRDGSWAAGSGPCRLILIVAGRQLASFPFETISSEAVLERVKVSGIRLEAIAKSGKPVRDPVSLQIGEHTAFAVTVGIEVAILAPNVAVDCAFVLKLNGVDIGHADSELQLHRPAQTIRCAKVSLASVARGQSSTPQELTIGVIIAGQEKGVRSVTIVSVCRVSNFEGQLTADPRTMEVDDTEYEEILHKL